MKNVKNKKIELILLISFIVIVGLLMIIFWSKISFFFQSKIGFIVLIVLIFLYIFNMVLGKNPQMTLFKAGANVVFDIGRELFKSFKMSNSESAVIRIFTLLFSCFIIVVYFATVFIIGFGFNLFIGLLFSPVFFAIALFNRKKTSKE